MKYLHSKEFFPDHRLPRNNFSLLNNAVGRLIVYSPSAFCVKDRQDMVHFSYLFCCLFVGFSALLLSPATCQEDEVTMKLVMVNAVSSFQGFIIMSLYRIFARYKPTPMCQRNFSNVKKYIIWTSARDINWKLERLACGRSGKRDGERFFPLFILLFVVFLNLLTLQNSTRNYFLCREDNIVQPC